MNHEHHRKYHHGRMKPMKRTVVTHHVVINEVEHNRDELLGYVEGLKFATQEKPMPIYNLAIEDQFVGDKLADRWIVQEGDKIVHKLVCTDEEARAAFEADLRSLDFSAE